MLVHLSNKSNVTMVKCRSVNIRTHASIHAQANTNTDLTLLALQYFHYYVKCLPSEKLKNYEKENERQDEIVVGLYDCSLLVCHTWIAVVLD